jgi:MATE family multidrug resistance protein
VVSYWAIGLPAAWWLGFGAGLGGAGIWAGLAIGLACAAILLSARFVVLAQRFGMGAASSK